MPSSTPLSLRSNGRQGREEEGEEEEEGRRGRGGLARGAYTTVPDADYGRRRNDYDDDSNDDDDDDDEEEEEQAGFNPFAAKKPAARRRDEEDDDDDDDPYWNDEQRSQLLAAGSGADASRAVKSDRRQMHLPAILRLGSDDGRIRAGGASTTLHVDDDSYNGDDDPFHRRRRTRTARTARTSSGGGGGGGRFGHAMFPRSRVPTSSESYYSDHLRGFWTYAAGLLLVAAAILLAVHHESSSPSLPSLSPSSSLSAPLEATSAELDVPKGENMEHRGWDGVDKGRNHDELGNGLPLVEQMSNPHSNYIAEKRDSDDDDNDNDSAEERLKKKKTAPPTTNGITASIAAAASPISWRGVVHRRDPYASYRKSDPFRLSSDPGWQYGHVFAPPSFPAYDNNDDVTDGNLLDDDNLGYAQYPDVHNGTVVFCSEGDLYLTILPSIELLPSSGAETSAANGGDDDDDSNDNVSSSLPISSTITTMPSMKLTTTVGNVLTPKINPVYPYLIAFTATYTGVREAYLIDVRPDRRMLPSMRLTYMDAAYGCERIVGWEDDGTTLVVSGRNDRVAVEDSRLYRISIARLVVGKMPHKEKEEKEKEEERGNEREDARKGEGPRRAVLLDSSSSPPPTPSLHLPAISGIEPIPLSQATEAVTDPASGCVYFTRYSQSSQTARYVGGTAEQLWAWCPERDRAVKITHDYDGTSKSPRLYSAGTGSGAQATGGDGGKRGTYLMFLSDREENGGGWDGKEKMTRESARKTNYGLYKAVNDKWKPGSMDLWAVELPTEADLYAKVNVDTETDAQLETSPTTPKISTIVRLTSIGCQFDGIPLSEYAPDAATGNIVLRIGADLHLLTREDVTKKLLESESALAEDDERGRMLDRWERWQRRAATTKKKKKKKKKKVELEPEDVNYDVEGEAKIDASPMMDTKTVGVDKGDGHDENEGDAAKIADVDVQSTPSPPPVPIRLPIVVYSDFHEMHERILIPSIPSDIQSTDVFPNPYGGLGVLHAVRGQAFVNPVIRDAQFDYTFGGGGMNIPPRRYRLAPGATTGGMIRVLSLRYIPDPEELVGPRRRALLLGTDPQSPTAEMAFYVVDAVPGTGEFDVPVFADASDLPVPILGGHVNGGSAREGGLGSVKADSVSVSPCGRRAAWTDTDGRISVMMIPPPPVSAAAMATLMAGANTTTMMPGAASGGTDREDGRSRRGTVVEAEEGESLAEVVILPRENESGEPMAGTEVGGLTWSPGGRYIAVEHNARNQFGVITIVDCGDPDGGHVLLGRAVQATPDRFNSVGACWGRTALDIKVEAAERAAFESMGVRPPAKAVPPPATTLFFLSDRDVVLSGVRSPWGTRAPSPHFERRLNMHALPLRGRGENGDDDDDDGYEEAEDDPLREVFAAPYMGGGAAEVLYMREAAFKAAEEANAAFNETEGEAVDADASIIRGAGHRKRRMKKPRRLENVPAGEDSAEAGMSSAPSFLPTEEPEPVSPYPTDNIITFGKSSKDGLDQFSFARRSYRVSNVPTANYLGIVSQLNDDASFVVIEIEGGRGRIKILSVGDFPSDSVEVLSIDVPGATLESASLSTSREFIHVTFVSISGGNAMMKVIPNTGEGVVGMLLKDTEDFSRNVVDTESWSLSVWPSLEYRQMYADAWRLLRDYFYDADMTSIDWPAVFRRYLPLVRRCSKREELDDVLRQMASELSALHVFVYGGEYSDPTHGSSEMKAANQVASLGATLKKSDEWEGYEVVEVPERDPDFNIMDGETIYSPLSDRTLRMSGQRGLTAGDVIVGVNGESVANIPGIGMLLRGMAGRSVRLDVLRVSSGPSYPASVYRRKRHGRNMQKADLELTELDDDEEGDGIVPEPLIVVPLSPSGAANLRYAAWEWKTRQQAKRLAADSNFTVGYIHLRDMSGATAEDSFVRGFYPDYDKQALIVDVRHNHGGNIDSWLLDVLQRKAWMYWKARATNITTGGLGWDEQFAFRGHLVVLTDEKTSSDGEGFSRGVSELGLGKIVGTRTWGGGIWLSSDNNLVDGGIATAPEIGTYNDKLGWGLGIEQMGVEPDIVVDNDPHECFGGRDAQLERAVSVLKEWLEKEPVVLPKDPGPHRDMSFENECRAGSAK